MGGCGEVEAALRPRAGLGLPLGLRCRSGEGREAREGPQTPGPARPSRLGDLEV